MDNNQEIEELKEALRASPDNHYLRMMLVRKMKLYKAYAKELEQQINEALKTGRDQTELKEILIEIYFNKAKLSACIVVGEGLDVANLSTNTLSILSRCYLKEGDRGKAEELYHLLIEKNPDYTNEELDSAFRVKAAAIKDGVDDLLFSKPKINFSDVGGMQNVKREIDMKIIKPLANADLFAAYGKKIGGGILLYGPPGCGKTFIAKATAGEINANFINIGLNDILDMWQGASERNLNKYFEFARSKQPCVIFFDEVDALGAKRSDLRGTTGKTIINQFLSELDGLNSQNDGLLVIGATNTPWHLDSAFLRPGRFDRIIFVPPPDEASRSSIVKLKLDNRPQQGIDYNKIAKVTKEFSGADINAMIDIAVELVLEEALQTGNPRPLTTKDILNASKKHRPSTVDWFTTAKNYAMFANKSGLYDDIIKYMK